jgi:hypothetical protein
VLQQHLPILEAMTNSSPLAQDDNGDGSPLSHPLSPQPAASGALPKSRPKGEDLGFWQVYIDSDKQS